MDTPAWDIAIVGAGPYGLSATAHMRACGLRTRVFGQTMSFWDEHMPKGMLVRSAWGATHFSDPHASFTLDAYEAEQPQPFPRPLPAEELCRYAHWFAARAVSDVDERLVRTVERNGTGFELTLEDGELVTAERVVIATGLRRFAQRPPQFDELPEDVAIHSVDMTEPARFKGQSVVVIGSGQSAVETAALVSEAGAQVELIARAPLIRWLLDGEKLRRVDPLVQRLLYAPTDVGPAGLSWIVSTPGLFRRLPISWQERAAYRSIRPAATGWLFNRVDDVTMTLGQRVESARPQGGGAHLTLNDGSHRQVDHVILGTGYAIDVTREPIVGESIHQGLRLHDGYPVLGAGFESTVRGLHFAGAYSAWSFGPIMRFVAGTGYTSRALVRHVADSGSGARPAPAENIPSLAGQPHAITRD